MADLDRPSPGLLVRVATLGVSLIAMIDDMRITMYLDDAEVVAGIGTQVLAAPTRKGLAFDHDGAEHFLEPLAVIDVGPGHDERQWDATTVHPQMALASFFPRFVGFGTTPSCAKGAFIIALSTLCHR